MGLFILAERRVENANMADVNTHGAMDVQEGPRGRERTNLKFVL